jgi:lipid II isoglutaminyl synthase (glutamine-hydrolysing)
LTEFEIASGGRKMLKKNMAIISGKTAGKLSRLLGHNGTTLPGVVALKIDPNIIRKMSEQVRHIIFITGTNGKTTTSNFLAHLLRSAGMKVINNTAGSNMISGIAACLINHAAITGSLKYDYAVLEMDEASLPAILKQMTPSMVVITNFFRDQLDRYGEIDSVIKEIADAIYPIETKLILNADDPLSVRLSSLNKDIVMFGLKQDAYHFGDHGTSESRYCPTCGEEMQYDHIHFNQLGFYSCSCGFKRPTPLYEIDTLENNPLTFTMKNETYQMNMAGAHNAYNALAAITCASELGVELNNIKESSRHFQSNNGRMEFFYFQGYPYIINLNKNPSGSTVSLSEILSTGQEKQIVFFLNDFIADGEDVSWIWDVDLECLQREDIQRIICSGSRSWDIALRLKYAGIDRNKMIIIPDIHKAIQFTFNQPMHTYLLPTYTALEQVRKYVMRSAK